MSSCHGRSGVNRNVSNCDNGKVISSTERGGRRRVGYLKADRIWVHHLFHDCSGGFLTLRLVLFRNCFRDPDDMYSVMNIT